MNSKPKSIEETYQKKSQLEHVLHRPGMYIGDIEPITTERWVFFDGKMSKKLIKIKVKAVCLRKAMDKKLELR